MDVGQVIRENRKERKLTLKELSQKTGISLSFLSDIERGRRKPSTENAIKIANSLSIDVSLLLPKEVIKAISTENTVSEPNTPYTLKTKDIKEIEEILKQTEEQLLSAEGLMFDGKPASPETIQKILDAMRIGMELAKKEAKEKYTPKKYRK